MTYQLRLPESLTATEWSGGTSTQLYIFPEHASYAARDFLVRISTATVTAENSLFTSLPGINRFLLILEGTLAIEHTGQYQKQLHAFDTDTFLGDWETKGIGKAIDFNVMTSNGVINHTTVLSLAAQETIKTSIAPNIDIKLWYAYKGSVQIQINKESILLPEGAVFIIYTENQTSDIILNSLAETKLIQTALAINSIS